MSNGYIENTIHNSSTCHTASHVKSCHATGNTHRHLRQHYIQSKHTVQVLGGSELDYFSYHVSPNY